MIMLSKLRPHKQIGDHPRLTQKTARAIFPPPPQKKLKTPRQISHKKQVGPIDPLAQTATVSY